MAGSNGAQPQNAAGHSAASNNKKLLGENPPEKLTAESAAVTAIDSVLDQLTPERVDALAEIGAREAATEIVAKRADFVAERIGKLGAAAVRTAARGRVDAFYKAHRARG